MAQRILPLIHDIPQLDTVYILCRSTSKHEEWTKAWVKVEGIHTDITSIRQSLQHVVKQLNHDSITISFIGVGEGASGDNLNQLEPSFMYTQIFKEILLEMDFDDQSVKNFATYCRNGNYGSSVNINQFENDYQPELAIWWYTYPSFVYSLLNHALRMMEADTIIIMGFFIRDLHRQIKKLHQQQINAYDDKPFIAYRGQGLSTTDFEKLRKTEGALMSFNSFFSTSKDQEVSLGYAMGALTNEDTVGILFRISISPSASSTPFAVIQEVSYFKTEEEILFSMHTIFRIGEIKQVGNNHSLYEVEIHLTSDDDPQLRSLTKRIQEETQGFTGWERLGQLLLRIGQFDKAEELYNTLLEQTSDDGKKGCHYHQLGYIKHDQKEYI